MVCGQVRSKNRIQQEMCLTEIDLCVHNSQTILDSIVNATRGSPCILSKTLSQSTKVPNITKQLQDGFFPKIEIAIFF